MRTREEQISHFSCAIFNERPGDIDECIALARKYILEAERRAEQRVRAEIGRDSDRLDWLEETAKTGFEVSTSYSEHPDVKLNDFCKGETVADTLREAIDAAREVG